MDWIRGEKLGHGSFATVNLAAPTSQRSGLPPLMAVKSCELSHSSSLMSEKLILEDLKDCPQIIGCFGERYSYENGEKFYNVLLEYAPGGSLAEKLRSSDEGRLPEPQVWRYTKALLRGLHYIHKFEYVHCDIKLHNILLGPNGSVKIADFGLAKRAGSGNPGWKLSGTPLYLSPETVAGGNQGPPSDIWALGCAVVELLSGTPAWRCSGVADLLMRIGVGDELPDIPCCLSEAGRDFLGKMLVKDPAKRWTAEMLLDHPFICCDQDLEEDKVASVSPRCPFDFPEWMSSPACSITSLPLVESPSISAAERLRNLVSDRCPDWSVSEDWVTIR